MKSTVLSVTTRIVERSAATRTAYLARIQKAAENGSSRSHLSCGNLAHSFAASDPEDKARLRQSKAPNLAIITAYNDMLSAHQPYGRYPEQIKIAARAVGATAQVAGGVPAMCDGVTQGQDGMQLSLFSRDVIAMATAIALSHNVFDAALCLGICDKIVPGLLIGALSFGHLPVLFVPSGPMASGISNTEKARVRNAFARGQASNSELLEAEAQSYHGPGTCTFYGTANSNQMLMEAMGLHIPGAAFVAPSTPLRSALTHAAVHRAVQITNGKDYTPLGRVISEKTIVNAMVSLLATGGSTNHTIHLIAIANAAGISITWDDFAELDSVTPLLARIYPNGSADVNRFHALGGAGFVLRELLAGGLLHPDVLTNMGTGLENYTQEAHLEGQRLAWRAPASVSLDEEVLRPLSTPFSREGGIKVLKGNLGAAIMKVSAVAAELLVLCAPAIVFEDPDALLADFKAGNLERDFIAVIRNQGPAANGMPELHKLTPTLSVLLDRGFKVGLLTDGRMSGASGKVPAAIHVSPEAARGGAIAKIATGDLIELNAREGTFNVRVSADELVRRPVQSVDLFENQFGVGRELFSMFRSSVGPAEAGASVFPLQS